VHELLAEGDGKELELGLAPLPAETRGGDEAIEIPGAAGFSVEVDRVPTAEEACHDGLRDARREGGRYRLVRG